MCLAIPSIVVERVDDMVAIVEVYGARKAVNLMLMPEAVELGEYVLVHAGFAIQKVDEAAALDALNLLKEMAELLEAEGIEPAEEETCSIDLSRPLADFS